MDNHTENSSQQNLSSEESLDDYTLSLETKVIFIFLGFAALVITIANILVLVLAWLMKSLRTKTNLFLLGLAASDLLTGVLVVPLLISCNVAYDNETICMAMDVCQRGLAISTILHLACAVSERYIKISSPFKYVFIVTKRRIAVVLFSVWTSAMTVSLAQLVMVDSLQDRVQIHLTYNATVLCLFVFIPFIVTFVTFIRIYLIMKQSTESRMKMTPARHSMTQRKKQRANEKGCVLVYLTMLVCFVLAWFPYFFLTLLIDLESPLVKDIPDWVSVMLLFLKISSALLDPPLFTFFKTDFQNALRRFASGSWKNATGVSRNSTRSTRKTPGSNRLSSANL